MTNHDDHQDRSLCTTAYLSRPVKHITLRIDAKTSQTNAPEEAGAALGSDLARAETTGA